MSISIVYLSQYLACLSSSSSCDKLAFDVGLQEHTEGKSVGAQFLRDDFSHGLIVCMATGESCWWTVHPSSKQRSEGEKVRVGDDAILVSVATERYLVRRAEPQLHEETKSNLCLAKG